MIYTKTGDKGTTSLVGGERVLKSNLRVDAYGSVDELNAHIGLLYELFAQEQYKQELNNIQHKLFIIQTLLATNKGEYIKTLPTILEQDIALLESCIDKLANDLPKLNSFVLPCGSLLSAQCHVARTVCRRAERVMVALNQSEEVECNLLIYINRLSDYLFVLARKAVYLANKTEVCWQAK